MRTKTKHVETVNQQSHAYRGRYFFDSAVAALFNHFGRAYRLKSLIRELENRKDDERFLGDIGLSREEVEKQIACLRQRYFQ